MCMALAGLPPGDPGRGLLLAALGHPQHSLARCGHGWGESLLQRLHVYADQTRCRYPRVVAVAEVALDLLLGVPLGLLLEPQKSSPWLVVPPNPLAQPTML